MNVGLLALGIVLGAALMLSVAVDLTPTARKDDARLAEAQTGSEACTALALNRSTGLTVAADCTRGLRLPVARRPRDIES